MDREKIKAALSAVELTQGLLVFEGRRGRCYCGIGAMLHGIGVSDQVLRNLDFTFTGTILDEIDREYGDQMAAHYGYEPAMSMTVLGEVLTAVDTYGALEADDVLERLYIAGLLPLLES